METQRLCPNCGLPTDKERQLKENENNHFRCYACEYEWDWKTSDPWPTQAILVNWAQFGIDPSALREVKLARLARDLQQVPIFAPLLSLSPENGALHLRDLPLNLNDHYQRDVGFGASQIELSTPSTTYLELHAQLYAFNHTVAALHVQYRKPWGDSPVADEILNRVYSGRLSSDDPVLVSYQNDAVMHQWQQAVEAKLGAAPTPEVPPEFAEHYDLLTALFDSLEVGTACGYAAAKPRGCKAMLTLVEHRQIDVLRKVLRCCRPEGRIYAAGGLLRLQAMGVDLSDADVEAIEKLRHSVVMIETCGGCSSSLLFSHSALYSLGMLPVA